MIVRAMLLAALMLATVGISPLPAGEAAIQGWKNPTCGCCSKWVDHLRANGFEVVAKDVDDLSTIKRMAGVPDRLQACHTAKVGDYVIEGHVPASAIERLLEERPNVAGLAVPGCPPARPACRAQPRSATTS